MVLLDEHDHPRSRLRGAAMDFTPTEEQELLRETARRLLADRCPPALIRAHIEDRTVAAGLWKPLGEWTVLANGPVVDLCVFMEECGAVIVPGPFFATTALYAPLVAAVEGRPVREGERGTVALAGTAGEWVPNAEPRKTFVPDVDLCERVAIVSGDVAGAGEAAGAVSVAFHDAATLDTREVATLDSTRRLFEVTAPDTGGAVVGGEVVEAMLERAWVVVAAEMLGTSRWLFDTTLAYAKSREQFGRPIGSFQAIQHKLANMALARERAWAAVYYAAMAIDAGDGRRRHAAHVAKAASDRAAHLCAKDAIQIHGGIGFTWEHDLHLWMRRAFASERLLGETAWHHDRLADAILV
jgi:alkylation response protein AidB-like acyl-CoA dehydrogenase